MNKSELLSKLLTLRASLSILSEYANDIKNLESEKAKKWQEEYNITRNRGRLFSQEGKEFFLKNKLDGELREKFNTLQKQKIFTSDLKGFLYEYNQNLAKGNAFKFLLLNAEGIPRSGPAYDAWVCENQKIKNYNKKLYEIFKLENKKLVEAIEFEYFKEINKYDNIKAKIGKKMESLNGIIRIYINQANLLYNEILQQYNNILSEVDWGNVDLIIYYLETHRADTLKEALLLVDNKKKHDELISTINSSTEYIASIINRRIYAIEKTLIISIDFLVQFINIKFDELHSNILSNGLRQIKLLEEQNIKLDEITKNSSIYKINLQKIISSNDIQNALLKSIDTSSIELARNVKEIINKV
jgi:hypothetical protein